MIYAPQQSLPAVKLDLRLRLPGHVERIGVASQRFIEITEQRARQSARLGKRFYSVRAPAVKLVASGQWIVAVDSRLFTSH
jgi:hypothetical protein